MVKKKDRTTNKNDKHIFLYRSFLLINCFSLLHIFLKIQSTSYFVRYTCIYMYQMRFINQKSVY